MRSRDGNVVDTGDGPRIVVLGLNHTSAPVDVREGIAISDDEALVAFRTIGNGSAAPEYALLSTCNRTEVYLASQTPEDALKQVTRTLDEIKHVDVLERDDWTYLYYDREAVEHLFRVACGLDSMLVGEAQIFNQIKHAYESASGAGQVGLYLNRVFQAALHVGKRARTETEIGLGAVSVASAAVGLTEKVFGTLGNRTALLIGAGETARLAAEHLSEHGIGTLIITNRTLERAESLASAVGGLTIPFEHRMRALPEADLVISATKSPEALITVSDVEDVMRNRPRRPLLLVDLAVPRDIDPSVNKLENVFLHDIDALKVMVEQNLVRRRKEVPRVEQIITEEIGEFVSWQQSLAVMPLIREVREQIETIRREQIERYGHQFVDADRDRLDQFTRTLVNRILHHPLTSMREFPQDTQWGPLRLETVRRLFGLDTGHGSTTNDTDRHTGE